MTFRTRGSLAIASDSRSIASERLRHLHRSGAALDQDIEAVDAGQVTINHGGGAAERVAGREEGDVIGVDVQPRRPDDGADARPQGRGEHHAWPARGKSGGGAQRPVRRSCGLRRAGGAGSQPSSVGTRTSETTKSGMTPTAAPTPNWRTATTSLVASASKPSAVVPLAPTAGVTTISHGVP